jgi:biopolymer transport protein ExbD
VNLPQAKGKDLPPEERVSIIIKKGGTVLLNDTPMSRQDMIGKLTAISKRNPNVFLKADKDVSYGAVIEVMGDIREAGIEKLGMVTEPKLSLK